jgi:hypothetical protein
MDEGGKIIGFAVPIWPAPRTPAGLPENGLHLGERVRFAVTFENVALAGRPVILAQFEQGPSTTSSISTQSLRWVCARP